MEAGAPSCWKHDSDKQHYIRLYGTFYYILFMQFIQANRMIYKPAPREMEKSAGP